MRRQIPGLSSSGPCQPEVPDGEYLVRVARARYRFDKNKPFYTLYFEVLEPVSLKQHAIIGRLYCHVKALWKLSWFLHDFGYDPDLLGSDELDEQALVGLIGVVKVSHQNINGRMLLRLDAFAPAERWSLFRGSAHRDAEVA